MSCYTNKVINLAFSLRSISKEEVEYVREGYLAETRDELLHVAGKKKVLPVVGKFLCNHNIDLKTWRLIYEQFRDKNLNVIGQVNEVFIHCHGKGISEIAVYENFGAMLYADTDIALYSSGDVDLYADLNRKQQIIDVMLSLGYVITDDKNHRRNLMTEFIREGSIVRINIGWKPLRRHSLPIKINTSRVIEWGKIGSYKDTSIRILDKNVLLYLCLLRIAVHGYSRSPDVRLYIDIYNAVCTNPDWNQVIAWAKEDRVLTKVVTVAYIANRLNGVLVPDYVIEMAKADRYARKIIQIAYDEENRTLKYDPKGLELLKLEAASDNKSVVAELATMAFPPAQWIKDFYTEDSCSITKAYINYYKRFIGK